MILYRIVRVVKVYTIHGHRTNSSSLRPEYVVGNIKDDIQLKYP